jgi:threonine/homoserine/homoserine lactone efflux protein
MFIGTGGMWCLLVAVFAARAARRVRQSGKGLVWINRALGGVFIYLGIRVALLEAR